VDIFEKIEQIREKPEHIRRRYVFICVTISMVLVFGIWMMSLKNSFNSSEKIIKEEDRVQMIQEIEKIKEIEISAPVKTIVEQEEEPDAEEEYELFNLSQ